MKQNTYDTATETATIAFQVAPQGWSLPAEQAAQWDATSEMSMLAAASSENWYFGTPCCMSHI